MMQIAIVARPGPVLDAYREFFEKHDVNLIRAASISELLSKLSMTAVSGFMVEIHIVLKATNTEKDHLRTLEGIFPNVRTNWGPQAGFGALYNEKGKSGEENLLRFIEDARKFEPRALRKEERLMKIFNVLFWAADASGETAQRAYTSDISLGGLFVCTCDPPQVDSSVWVQLREVDARPFKVLVKWKVAWGVGASVPGFGGSFVQPDDSLAKKLEALLAKKKNT